METSVETKGSSGSRGRWPGTHVYVMAAVCLLVGVLVGYLIRGSYQPAQVQSSASHDGHDHGATSDHSHDEAQAMPTMDQMKHMADKKAEPLLTQLKEKPNDPALLSQIAKIYFTAHQFPDAISYAERAVQADPQKVGNRADLASYQYYGGDADKAIATLDEALKLEPGNPQALFNLGMMKLQGKDDATGAVAAWKQLLKSNPKLPATHKQMVEKAIASASKKAIAAK